MSGACDSSNRDSSNRTLTAANPESMSSHEMWRGEPAKLQISPILHPTLPCKEDEKVRPEGCGVVPLEACPKQPPGTMGIPDEQTRAVISSGTSTGGTPSRRRCVILPRSEGGRGKGRRQCPSRFGAKGGDGRGQRSVGLERVRARGGCGA